MPVERTRGSRRSGADGANLVWTEPTTTGEGSGGVAFATNLTPTAFASSYSAEGVEPAALSTGSSSFFFFESAAPKRPSHKRKLPASSSSSPSSPSSPTAAASPSSQTQTQQHIPRPPNAFILFRSAFIRSGAVPASSESSHATLSTIAGLAWSKLPADARGTWHEKARRAREEHGRRFPGYAFRPTRRGSGKGGGGGDEVEEDVKVKVKVKEAVTQPKRRTRETVPADLARCEHIAKLVALGRTGAQLEEEVRAFDAGRGERVVEVRWESEEREKERDVKVRKTAAAGVRRRVKSEPSTPPSPVTPPPVTPGPFDFDYDSPLPSPLVDDNTTAFPWPPSSLPPSPALSYATASPIDPFSFSFCDTAPPSPALSFASPALSSSSSLSSSSARSSLDDLSSLTSFGTAPPTYDACAAGLDVYSASSAYHDHPCGGLELQPAFEIDITNSLTGLGLALGFDSDAYDQQQQYAAAYPQQTHRIAEPTTTTAIW